MRLFQRLVMDPETVADVRIRAMQERQISVTVGGYIKALILASRFLAAASQIRWRRGCLLQRMQARPRDRFPEALASAARFSRVADSPCGSAARCTVQPCCSPERRLRANPHSAR